MSTRNSQPTADPFRLTRNDAREVLWIRFNRNPPDAWALDPERAGLNDRYVVSVHKDPGLVLMFIEQLAERHGWILLSELSIPEIMAGLTLGQILDHYKWD